MTLLAPTRAPAAKETRARELTHWSWWMVPVFVVVWVAAGLLTYAALGWFGLEEGDLVLMAHSAGAWVLDVVVWAVSAAAPVTGAVLAARALRLGAAGSARVALVLNALLVLVVAYGVVDEARMSY